MYQLDNNIWRETSSRQIEDTLPIGVYIIQYDIRTETYYFEETETKPLPEKLYGDIESLGARILQTYADRETSGKQTGIILGGEKGSGKTLLLRWLAKNANLPVVLVQEPFSDIEFLKTISKLGKVLLAFEEFEKVYSEKSTQQALLSLFDGVLAFKGLTCITVNHVQALIPEFFDRPERFFYNINYNPIDLVFIKEFCEERLDNYNEFKLRQIYYIALRHSRFNFDLLQALVEECNRYQETPAEAVKLLNLRMYQSCGTASYKVEVLENNKPREVLCHLYHNPLQEPRFIVELVQKSAIDNQEDDVEDLIVDINSLMELDLETGFYRFRQGNFKITVTAIPPETIEFPAFLLED